MNPFNDGIALQRRSSRRGLFGMVGVVALALLIPTLGMTQEVDTDAIAKDIEAYTTSIDNCDINLASKIWLTTPDVSFVHPRGHEHGWDEIVHNFYGKTMGDNFSKRTRTVVGTPTIKRFTADLAIAEFDWDFVAIWAKTGQQLHTKGRETQVYAKISDDGWRLGHVHYSGPVQTAPSQGF